MIQVNVLLYPHGDASKLKCIGKVKIWNDKTGTPLLGNYKYELKGANNVPMGGGEIKSFRRLQSHVLRLLKRVLDDHYG